MKIHAPEILCRITLLLLALLACCPLGHARSGTPYCFGDGSGTACPCANNGFAGHGCRNGKYVEGGLLTDTGLASVSSDTLVLSGRFISGKARVVSGTSQLAGGNGIPFGDGLRCVGGSLIYTKVHVPNGIGEVNFPTAGELPLSVLGFSSPGTVRHYQIVYLDKKLFYCTPKQDNGTNGMSIVWLP